MGERIGLEPAAHLEAVHARHHHVEQHDVAFAALADGDRVRPVGRRKHLEILCVEARIEQLEVSVNGGAPRSVTLPDEYISFSPDSWKAYQLIELGSYPGEAKTITLTVKKVYPGTRYNDTCVSEILLRKRLEKKPQVQGAR